VNLNGIAFNTILPSIQAVFEYGFGKNCARSFQKCAQYRELPGGEFD
jgi:hypothetical protein